MRDIENREDLLFLMHAFYSRMLEDPEVGYIFTDVAKIKLEHHLPLLADFWNNALFHTGGYKNNVVQIHKDLDSFRFHHSHQGVKILIHFLHYSP